MGDTWEFRIVIRNWWTWLWRSTTPRYTPKACGPQRCILFSVFRKPDRQLHHVQLKVNRYSLFWTDHYNICTSQNSWAIKQHNRHLATCSGIHITARSTPGVQSILTDCYASYSSFFTTMASNPKCHHKIRWSGGALCLDYVQTRWIAQEIEFSYSSIDMYGSGSSAEPVKRNFETNLQLWTKVRIIKTNWIDWKSPPRPK